MDRHDLTDDHIRMLGDAAARCGDPLASTASCAFSFRRRDLDDDAWHQARQAVADRWNARVAELGDDVSGLLDELDEVIVDRLEIDLVRLLDGTERLWDPGVAAWLAHDPAQDAWRIAATAHSLPLGERALGLRASDDMLGSEIRGEICRAMRDLRAMDSHRDSRDASDRG